MNVQWTPDLAVGVEAIDKQHQDLFKAVDDLLEAMKTGQGRTKVDSILTFLEGYVVKHFAGEEKLMQKERYPGYAAHLAEHKKFVDDFGALKAAYQKQGATPTVIHDVMARVADWLRTHISVRDKALGAFLKDRKTVEEPAPAPKPTATPPPLPTKKPAEKPAAPVATKPAEKPAAVAAAVATPARPAPKAPEKSPGKPASSGIAWSGELAWGIDPLDSQNQELFQAIDKLVTAMSNAKSRDEVPNTVQFLARYAATHYDAEARYLSGAPNASAHLAEHQALIADIKRFEAELGQRGPDIMLAMDVSLRMGKWLREHIGGSDKAVADWMRSRAKRS